MVSGLRLCLIGWFRGLLCNRALRVVVEILNLIVWNGLRRRIGRRVLVRALYLMRTCLFACTVRV